MFGSSGDSDANDGKLRSLEGGTWLLVRLLTEHHSPFRFRL